ncbi:MAG: hypothetical protein L3J31_06785 [Bacteroidales bacterium]|nr:hypothetical protein [Bacteroidales bacterium]MCF6342493.1 hypothetical protein [Bacteroidales bacterium]
MVLLDVMLPKLDGFSIARTIRETALHLPFIFITAKTLHGSGYRLIGV